VLFLACGFRVYEILPLQLTEVFGPVILLLRLTTNEIKVPKKIKISPTNNTVSHIMTLCIPGKIYAAMGSARKQ
jgi:hypothetical protein